MVPPRTPSGNRGGTQMVPPRTPSDDACATSDVEGRLDHGLTQPGKAGPYAHHRDLLRRGEACLALVWDGPHGSPLWFRAQTVVRVTAALIPHMACWRAWTTTCSFHRPPGLAGRHHILCSRVDSRWRAE
jgi:hypothetical protein